MATIKEIIDKERALDRSIKAVGEMVSILETSTNPKAVRDWFKSNHMPSMPDAAVDILISLTDYKKFLTHYIASTEVSDLI